VLLFFCVTYFITRLLVGIGSVLGQKIVSMVEVCNFDPVLFAFITQFLTDSIFIRKPLF